MIKVFFLNGHEKGNCKEYTEKVVSIGRSSSSTIKLSDSSVSRNHVQIKWVNKKNSYFIKDLKSTNGTFINGEPVEPGIDTSVEEGVPISVGNVFISLGKQYSGKGLEVQAAIDVASGLNETGVFDRPMTSPKNLEIIYNVSSILMQSLYINDTLEKILDHIFDLLQRVERGVILLFDHDTGKVSDIITRSIDNQRTIFPYSKSIVNRVFKEGKALIMSDTLRQDNVPRSESMELMKIRSVMCVPLISRSKVLGVIYIDSIKRPYGFRKEDLSLISALSVNAAIAIENAMLYSGLEKIVEERTKNLKETEQKLRESEERFKAIFNNMSSGVIVYKVKDEGKDFIILDFNRAEKRIEKIMKKEAVGKSVFEVFPYIKRTGLPEIFKNVWEKGKAVSKSITLTVDGENEIYRDYYIYRLPTGEIVSIFDDITDQKVAEREQQNLQEKLFVSQKMESIGAFAGGTAHNFRNILQAISGNIEYLKMVHGDKTEVTEITHSILSSVEKGVDLINNLLHFSKLGGQYQMMELDCKNLIMNTYSLIEKVFNKNIEFELLIEDGLFVNGNPSLLSQVFMNLFTNARDAMPDGGKLTIKGEIVGNHVSVIVADTGQGMDEATVEKIFDPFFTLKEVGKGTGLGLSTSHGIIDQHNGKISVQSNLGQGTIFNVQIPFADIDHIEEKKEPVKQIIYGKGERVLIVDDEMPVLESLVSLTQKLGYQAIPLNSSLEVLEYYRQWEPDIVLMDRNMPDKDGVACAKEINKYDSNAKIIFVSGFEETGPNGIDNDIKKIIKGYITKPCGMKMLSLEISEALGT